VKKIIKVCVFCVVGLFVQISTSQAAEISCPVMELWNINATGAWAKNVSGAPCGGIANGDSRLFTFDPAQKDQLLAIALTSMSLDKNAWVHALGDTNGSIIDIIGLAK